MLNVQSEKLSLIIPEIEPLTVEHWREVAWYQDKMELSPIWSQYKQLEDAGVLNLYTLREGPLLVGYAIFFLIPSLHYSEHTVADNDICYVDKDYRHSAAPGELLRYAEIDLQAQGASVIAVKMKADKTFHGLMEGLGYSLMEHNYTKYIGR